MVRKAGLEPACLSAPPPQDGVSANSTTSALPIVANARAVCPGHNNALISKEHIQRQIEYNKLSAIGKLWRAAENKQLLWNSGRDHAVRPESAVTYHCTILANDSALRLAPPTSAPSISSWESNWWAFSGLTLPPYRMQSWWAYSSPKTLAASWRIIWCASLAISGVAVRPVPMAQTGS